MFIEDEAKVPSRVGGVERGVVDFVEVLFESIGYESSLGGIER